MRTHRSIRHILVLLLTAAVLPACKHDRKGTDPNPPPSDDTYNLVYPSNFPVPPIPSDNLLTNKRVALGRRLFYEKILSRDTSIACGSCHKPELAFTNGSKVALGVGGAKGTRNPPSLANMVYSTSYNWDGGTASLEQQAMVPLQAHIEMDMTFPEIIDRLSKHPEYPTLFQEAYGTGPENNTLLKALGAFERTFICGDSRYDRFKRGDSTALTASEQRGMVIFNGEVAECWHCHGGTMFTDGSYQNNGLYANYIDQGRYNVTQLESDQGRFKVPTLRNIALTAPYMHDGSKATLEQVLDHYMTGGKPHPNKSVLVRPFTLSAQERDDLLNFLRALTDSSFVTNPAFGAP